MRLLLMFASVCGLFYSSSLAQSPRDLQQITFAGNESFPAEQIIDALRYSPQMAAVLEPSTADDAFARMLQELVTRGYQVRGFMQCQIKVEAKAENKGWTVHVKEGPTLKAGPVSIEGNEGLKEYLEPLVAEHLAKAPKKFWASGEAWSPVVADFQGLQQSQCDALGQWLLSVGLAPWSMKWNIQPAQGSDQPLANFIMQFPPEVQRPTVSAIEIAPAVADLARDALAAVGIQLQANYDPRSLLEAEIELYKTGRVSHVSVRVDHNGGLGKVKIIVEAQPLDVEPSSEVVEQYAKLIDFWRATFGPDAKHLECQVELISPEYQGQIWMTQKWLAAEVTQNNKVVLRIAHDEDTVRTAVELKDRVKCAIELPNPWMTVLLQYTPDAEKPFLFNTNVSFNTQPLDAQPSRMLCDLGTFAQAFTMPEFSCETQGDHTIYLSKLGRLEVDADNQLVSFEMSRDDVEASLTLRPAREIPAACKELATNNSLPCIVRLEENEKQESIFPVPNPQIPTTGAAVIFWELLVRQGQLPKDGLADQLLRCYAIALTGEKAAFKSCRERIEKEHACGPLAKLALAMMTRSVGDAETYQRLMQESQSLVADKEAISRDFDAIFAEGGRLAAGFKELDPVVVHELATEIVAEFKLPPGVIDFVKWCGPNGEHGLAGWRNVVVKSFPVAIMPSAIKIATNPSQRRQ